MLKKGAKLRVSNRQPAQYFADLGVLMQEQTTEKVHKSDQQLSNEDVFLTRKWMMQMKRKRRSR